MTSPLKRTRYHIRKMDCSAEERLVRMALEDIPDVEHLEFDFGARVVGVLHRGSREAIGDALIELGLGASEVEHEDAASTAVESGGGSASQERRLLLGALGINGALFVGELAAGLLFSSMGLVADSLDMLADAFVYALSLAAVGHGATRKKKLAASSGYLQLALALFGLFEVVRRFITPTEEPDALAMIAVSAIALAGNVATLLLLRRAQRGEAHIEASWIFTSNDVLVNLLVIGAALVVWWSDSSVPDLVAGGLIFLIVANGARRILALARDRKSGPSSCSGSCEEQG